MSQEREVSQDNDETGEGTRREALTRMGKYAAYTAPALVALVVPDEGHATGWRLLRRRRRRRRRVPTSYH